MIPREKVVEILDKLMRKTRANEVNWQPSGANESTYVVNFHNSYLSIEGGPNPDVSGSMANAMNPYEVRIYRSVDNMDTLVARYTFGPHDPEHEWGLVAELYKQASRVATGWDQVLEEIEKAVTHPGRIGLEV